MNTHHTSSTRHHCTIQPKWPSWSKWMDIHWNFKRNLWTTSCRNSCKKLNSPTFKQPQIISSQTNTSIMTECVETDFIYIGSERFWNWLHWTESGISSDEWIKNVSWKITTDWEGELYYGITMKHDYTKQYVDISMPIYFKEALHQFNNKALTATSSSTSSTRKDIWCSCQ